MGAQSGAELTNAEGFAWSRVLLQRFTALRYALGDRRTPARIRHVSSRIERSRFVTLVMPERDGGVPPTDRAPSISHVEPTWVIELLCGGAASVELSGLRERQPLGLTAVALVQGRRARFLASQRGAISQDRPRLRHSAILR